MDTTELAGLREHKRYTNEALSLPSETGYVRAASEIKALQKEVAELRGDRQRLRDAVNTLYDQALKNMNGAIGAEEVAVATYWDGQKDGLSIVIDLLETPEPPKEP